MAQCLNPNCLKSNPLETKFCQSCGEKLILRERYCPLKIIGQGGFGITFQAVDEDKPSKPFCVIKQFFPQAQGTNTLEKAAELFAQEAERLDSLGKHSQIPELFAYFTQDNRQYLVQEFIDGQNLQQELEESGAFDESQILELLKSLLPVLEFIHSQQVIHRDIKPENIIRKSSPDALEKGGDMVLVDFGAAKYATMTALARMGTVIGSVGYVAPEQAIGKATFASDIYSLGVTCINLLTGVEPFNLFDVSENDWVWRNYLRSDISDEVGEILDKMIVGATKKRFKNAGEILSLIEPNFQPQTPNFTLPKPTFSPEISQLSIIQSTAQRQKKYTFPLTICQSPTEELEKGELFTFEVITVNKSGYITKVTLGSARQKIEDLGNGIKLEMVYIPGGSFLMGSPKNEKERDNSESPQHQVTLQPFYMSKYPITQEQYQVIMGKNPSSFKGKGGKRPVESVNWYNAIEFCRELSLKTGKTWKLPSESQWEYACRAGTRTPFYFGETITPDLVNYDGNSPYGNAPKGKYREETTDVGTFPPNAFGLYDMHGNVWEWCQDIWHDNYNEAPTDGSAWETGGDSGSRVLRGGCWVINSGICRCAWRGDDVADSCDDSRGFRIISSSATD
ncbi:bifunctional serine/threonine-protein kinase/formylglycine-generating enzyme family protein [Okeania sp.]|uniref:bifunctional serine/threonine-protein kinase/formylglycine-generating enzyme family protein n=1 Tax=Okeania sp. TaxID=3100323 RepID=UPI002B4B0EB7|nr:bifunctional serine/threonine-protein kinase/formylglycine-generating enzyme family protein [Okeania sp.]MEB3342693.1 bifunctional serine/threonine-protein kinase/formylglycine-generating enzyme family protein [Okeania sp.]